MLTESEDCADVLHADVGKAGDPIRAEVFIDNMDEPVDIAFSEATLVELLKRRGFLVYAPGSFISVPATTLVPTCHVLEILKKRGYHIEAPEESTEPSALTVN